MRLLSRFSSDSIVFLSNRGGKISFHVAVHGLWDLMGLDAETFEAELNDGRFMPRVVESERDAMRELSLSSAAEGKNFCASFRITNARGETVSLYLKTDYVHDEYSDVEYIVTLRRREEH